MRRGRKRRMVNLQEFEELLDKISAEGFEYRSATNLGVSRVYTPRGTRVVSRGGGTARLINFLLSNAQAIYDELEAARD